MQRQLLKSKIHRAVITDADIDYEGSISIPEDLMEEVGFWPGEKVLVASITKGARLETYVQKGARGSGQVVMNGGAAHLISKGELVTIMSFGLSEEPIEAKVLVCGEGNTLR